MRNLIICLFFVFSTTVFACESPHSSIRDLEKLVAKVEKNYKSYSEKDWEKIEKQFSEIKNKIEEYEFSQEELERIGYLKGRMAGYMAKIKIKKLGEGVKEATKVFESSVEGFIEVLRE